MKPMQPHWKMLVVIPEVNARLARLIWGGWMTLLLADMPRRSWLPMQLACASGCMHMHAPVS